LKIIIIIIIIIIILCGYSGNFAMAVGFDFQLLLRMKGL